MGWVLLHVHGHLVLLDASTVLVPNCHVGNILHGTLDSPTLPFHPPHSANRHDDHCPGDGADRVATSFALVSREHEKIATAYGIGEHSPKRCIFRATLAKSVVQDASGSAESHQLVIMLAGGHYHMTSKVQAFGRIPYC